MKQLFLKTLIVYFLFNFNLSASPCLEEKIKYELTKMKLDPNIKTNKELMISIQFIYGKKMLDTLFQEHIFIKANPDANIDRDTLHWLNDMIWHKENKNVVYRYFPGDLSSQEALDYFVGDMNAALVSRQRTIPIFQHIESKYVYDAILKSGAENELKKIIERLQLAPTDALNEQLTRQFLLHFRKYNEVKIGLNFSPDNPIILEISGHAIAGMPVYILGGKSVSVEDIVHNLVDMKVPLNATIRLIGCFSACSSDTTSYSTSEVKKLFQQRRLNEIYDKGQSSSFLQAFSSELKNKLPLFHGHIVGYIGEVMDIVGKNVFTVNGNYETTYSVRVLTTDGHLELKRDEASFFYDHSIP